MKHHHLQGVTLEEEVEVEDVTTAEEEDVVKDVVEVTTNVKGMMRGLLMISTEIG